MDDLDFATASTLPLDVITDRLASVYRAAGYDVQVIETAPTMARFEVQMTMLTSSRDSSPSSGIPDSTLVEAEPNEVAASNEKGADAPAEFARGPSPST